MNGETAGLSVFLLAMPGERELGERVRSVQNAACETVAADLGAPVQELEDAQRAGADVLRIPWENSFAAVKNICMERASGRWVLFLHQNEYIEPESLHSLTALLRNPNAEAYMVFAGYRAVSSPVQALRLIRRRSEYRFLYRSFEALPEEMLTGIAESHLTIQTAGEKSWEYETRSRLLREEEKENPEDGYLSYMGGLEKINEGLPEKSIPFFTRTLGALSPEALYAPHLYKCAAWALFTEGRTEEAAALTDGGIRAYPLYSDLFVLRAQLSQALGRYADAERDLKQCLSVLRQPSLFVPGPEIGASDVLHALGELYEDTGNKTRARFCFRQARVAGGGEEYAGRTEQKAAADLSDERKAALWAEKFIRRSRRKIRSLSVEPASSGGTQAPDEALWAFCRSLQGGKTEPEDVPREQSNARLHEKIGDLYAARGRKNEAISAYLRALRLEPTAHGSLEKLEVLTRGERGLFRGLGKSEWREEGGVFVNAREFTRFLAGAFLFRRGRYGLALKLFSAEPESPGCRTLYAAYRTGILWVLGKRPRLLPEYRTPAFAGELSSVCAAAVRNRLNGILASEACFSYRDLLEQTVQKAEKAFLFST